eukprot:10186859-Alexandrium_andersonii.AAC.1
MLSVRQPHRCLFSTSASAASGRRRSRCAQRASSSAMVAKRVRRSSKGTSGSCQARMLPRLWTLS